MGLSQHLSGYEEVAGCQSQDSTDFERCTGEEKERFEGHLQKEADRSESPLPIESKQESVQGKDRKKSVGRTNGGQIGTAFTGYNMKLDGKGIANRW